MRSRPRQADQRQIELKEQMKAQRDAFQYRGLLGFELVNFYENFSLFSISFKLSERVKRASIFFNLQFLHRLNLKIHFSSQYQNSHLKLLKDPRWAGALVGMSLKFHQELNAGMKVIRLYLKKSPKWSNKCFLFVVNFVSVIFFLSNLHT